MLEHIHPKTMAQIKKWGFLLFWFSVLPILPLAAYAGRESGTQDYWAWLIYFIVFGLVPILDYIVGKDPTNPDEHTDVPRMSAEKTYRVFTLLVPLVWFGALYFAGYIFMNNDYSLLGQVGWILSIGTVGGAVGIVVAHELVHKDERLENWMGGLLLSSVCYAGFKVEHIRGHHVFVATPNDGASAQYNQSVWHFLPRAMVHNFMTAWQLEAQRLVRKGRKPFSIHNELIWWYSISALFMLSFFLLWGWQGALFFLLVSLVASATLEVINYVEHYGLHRRILENGKYERVTPAHSWNSNYFLTNLALFHLQRHSDHHAYAKRRYQVLRHYDDSPQLPGGYASMYVLALIPPLWKKVMNPRVEAYYEGELDQLFRKRPRIDNSVSAR
ncbi:MAG: alkane 1-monooxygenase [Halomonadaceae bacterium]|nr:MAG: alkane 1-monooxygenase [Halomonadaceae bacterium]